MPTYDYECSGCKDRQELFHKMNDDTVYTCSKMIEDKPCRSILNKIVLSANVLISKHNRADFDPRKDYRDTVETEHNT